MKQLLIYSCLGVCNLIPAKQGYVHISKKHFWPKISQGVVYTINIYSLCKKIFFFGIFCMCYNLHIMQIINLHGQFAPNWKNSNYSKIVIFACKYTRIGIIACNIYQNWYICSVQTITVCAILSIWTNHCMIWVIILRSESSVQLLYSENFSCQTLGKWF